MSDTGAILFYQYKINYLIADWYTKVLNGNFTTVAALNMASDCRRVKNFLITATIKRTALAFRT